METLLGRPIRTSVEEDGVSYGYKYGIVVSPSELNRLQTPFEVQKFCIKKKREAILGSLKYKFGEPVQTITAYGNPTYVFEGVVNQDQIDMYKGPPDVSLLLKKWNK